MNNSILYWNSVLLEASRRDFTAAFVAVPQQGGPTRTSRAMAIVQIAIHDAWFGINGPHDTYLLTKTGVTPPLTSPAAADSAVAAAAFATLSALYPAFLPLFDDALAGAPRGAAAAEDQNGTAFGQAVAAQLLTLRATDNASGSRPYAPRKIYGHHDADPYNPGAGHVTPHWGDVRHFTVGDPDPVTGMPNHAPLANFPGSAFPTDYLLDGDYEADYREVQELGRRGVTARTPEQTMIGQFWGYDGAPELGVPPRLYNQIVRRLAIAGRWSAADCARRFMLANVAMADAGIDAWHWKYEYDLWRPVVAIRHAARSCGPDAAAAGSSVKTPEGLLGDPFWAPLGLPRTNQVGAGPATPQFPAYPSGHATFAAAMFQVLQRELTDREITIEQVLACEQAIVDDSETTFELVSDEQDGHSVDADGSLRTRHARKFASFCHAVYENSVSRVYLGVHWRFDGLPRRADQVDVGGVPLGLAIGNRVFTFFNS